MKRIKIKMERDIEQSTGKDLIFGGRSPRQVSYVSFYYQWSEALSHFNSMDLSGLLIMNWLSQKPLAALNSVITNFNVKNPFHSQYSIYHWSWAMMIRTYMYVKSLEAIKVQSYPLEPSGWLLLLASSHYDSGHPEIALNYLFFTIWAAS